MIDRDKVIKGLECCTQYGSMCGLDCNGHWGWTDDSHTDMELLNEYRTKCPYGNCKTGCVKTLAKDALALLKAQEPCMDAVSREAVLDLAQTYGPATYDMPYGSGDMIIRPEDVKTLPSVQPIPLARVLTLEEIDGNPEHRKEYFVEFNYYQEYMDDSGYCRVSANSDGIMVTIWMAKHVLTEDMRDYNKAWRCWTSKPTDEQRKAVKWDV